MELGLAGKVALVTGGGRDVGGEIARSLVAEGVKVAINYARSAVEAQRLAEAIRAEGGEAWPLKADISDYAQVEWMVDEIVGSWGRLDILVNNAGFVKYQRFVESGPDDWKPQFDVCTYGTLHCCRAVAPHMIRQEHGRIVNIVGDSSRIGEANLSIAAAARGANIALGKSLAKELGRSGVTVNSVGLGLVETSHSDADFLAKNMDRIVRQYPLRRIGKPGDVAPMVTFLASDAASWITGQVISVNGGFCMV